MAEGRRGDPGTDRRFDSFENAAPVIRCHEANIAELRRRLIRIEQMLDTHGSPWWKRTLFWLDGWGPWWIVRREPRWRPWRRWYRS